jgi:hypothetical protein
MKNKRGHDSQMIDGSTASPGRFWTSGNGPAALDRCSVRSAYLESLFAHFFLSFRDHRADRETLGLDALLDSAVDEY